MGKLNEEQLLIVAAMDFQKVLILKVSSIMKANKRKEITINMIINSLR